MGEGHWGRGTLGEGVSGNTDSVRDGYSTSNNLQVKLARVTEQLEPQQREGAHGDQIFVSAVLA